VEPIDFPDLPDLTAWVARLAADDAARERSRAAWLQRQAEDEGTFAGVLADLAERGRAVVVHLHNGRRHRGALAALGADFVILANGEGREVLVRRDAIASVHTLPGEPLTIGDRLVISEATLGEALSALGEERARVLVMGLDAGAGVRGELRSVGADVLTVRQDGGATAYVALASVAEVSLTAESG
jgi:sRNA-binding regulator protein Hfq